MAIIDSGVDPCHPRIGAIQSCIALSHSTNDVTICQNDFTDPAGHGTACAGIVRRLAPEARIYSIRILGSSFQGDGRSIVSAIQWAIRQGINIINLSLGTTDGACRSQLEEVCNQAAEAGVILVAADHNEGTPSYPAHLPTVIGVGGSPTRGNYEYACHSGKNIECLTRADQQRLCWTKGKDILMDGTSFAAPRISAIIALILQQHPGANLETVRAILNANATEISDPNPRVTTATPRASEASNLSGKTAHSAKKYEWIKRAALYPFNKELHALVRFRELLPFEIVAIADPVGKGLVGKDAGEVLGIPPVGIPITAKLAEAVRSADTLILGCVDQLVRMSKRDLLRESVELALESGANVFSISPIRKDAYPILFQKAETRGLHLESPDVTPEQIASALADTRDYGPVTAPVLGVFGTSSQQGKFTAQLSLRRELSGRGYSVGQIGTEHHSELFGMDFAFPMGYNSPLRIPLQFYAPFLDHKMREISSRNPDIIVVGSQSGTIPYDIYEPSTHSLPTIAFLFGVKPDAAILVVNTIDSLDYIHNTIKVLRVISGTSTILLAMSDKKKHIRTAYGRQLVSPEQMSETEIDTHLQKLTKEFGLPTVSIASPLGQKQMADQVISHFSDQKTTEGAEPCPNIA